jgi:hypothetical protein
MSSKYFVREGFRVTVALYMLIVKQTNKQTAPQHTLIIKEQTDG